MTTTKNTTLHKIKYDKTTVVFRDLTINEVCFLKNIKEEVYKQEYAGTFAIVEPTDTTSIPWAIKLQVGQRAIFNSTKTLNDKDLFEVTVKEYRQQLEKDTTSPMPLMIEILKVLPGQSITELLNMTYNDLIEIACVCESLSGKQILNVEKGFTKKKGIKLLDPKTLPDDGKSLQEKMTELNLALGNR